MFFSGKVAVRGRRWRVSVSAGARLDPESGRQNVHETSAHNNRKKTDGLRPLFDDEVDIGRQNAHETVARSRFHIKIVKKTDGLGPIWTTI